VFDPLAIILQKLQMRPFKTNC